MIEKIILDYLNQVLTVPVFMEQPLDAPSQFVLVEKTGSSKSNQIESATMVFQSYADTLEHTAMLNEEVKSAMDNAINLSMIADSSLNSDYYFPDQTKHKYRYQAVYDLVFH